MPARLVDSGRTPGPGHKPAPGPLHIPTAPGSVPQAASPSADPRAEPLPAARAPNTPGRLAAARRALRGLRCRTPVPLRGGSLKRGPLQHRAGSAQLVTAIPLRNLSVSGTGGSRLLGRCPHRSSNCPHRHRRRHRAELARDRRLRRRHRLSATTGLARQHLLDDGVVGPLQYLAGPGRERRVGR